MRIDTSNITQLWASLLVEELVRAGVEFFCLAPGSRSTPLTAAAARHPKTRCVMHYDERGSAFMALGYGRATSRPAAWVTTSGTAVANGLPAVVEASVDNVPLLLVTADRPPELRETGANQTVDQVKLFGDYVRWFFDLPVPTTMIDPAMVLTTADQAVYRTHRAPAGPVHLNAMFRKPLHPEEDGRAYDGYLDGLAHWREGIEPYTSYAPQHTLAEETTIRDIAIRLSTVERGLIIVGRLDTEAERAAARMLSEQLGWPVLPDVTSGLRLSPWTAAETPRISYYDQVLADEDFRKEYRAEAVLHVGGRVQSKRLRQYLRACPLRFYVVVRPDPARLDPGHRVTQRVEAEVAAFCEALAGYVDVPPAANDDWRATWQHADSCAAAVHEAFACEAAVLTEPLAARLVTQYLPEHHGLFLASSMPVREVDRFGIAQEEGVRVAANRGASGIDGTISAAVGFARGCETPVTLLIGDLALLHDLNALSLLREASVTVVLLNNDGGGIFSFLPIAASTEVFEPYFATPHGLGSFEHAAALFGLDYARPESKAAFVEAYRAACASGGATLIEVQTDRAENCALHEEIDRRIVEALVEI